MAKKKKKWIQKAIKHPGRMKNAAKRAGMSTKEYEEKHKHDKGSIGRAARLGLALSGKSKGANKKTGKWKKGHTKVTGGKRDVRGKRVIG